jgi:regulator of sigma E protease
VLRQDEHTSKRVDLEMEWDPSYRAESGQAYNPGTPTAVNGLGLAYHVQTLVDAVAPDSPAAAAGVRPNDQVAEVRFTSRGHTGKEVTTGWEGVVAHQWAFVDYNVQAQFPHTLQVKVRRGEELIELPPIVAVEDRTWPVTERGLIFADETRVQKADGIGSALEMGAHRTLRSIKTIYQNLYAMIFGRISVKLMAGPLTLARASYLLAGEDVWYLLLLMAMISINLAVVNFLPIPVLDGGHMMFLLYEAVRGKPAPESIQVVLTYVGLGLVGCLMLFVIGLDVWRLFFS